jgi:hypothetical protein
MKAITDYFEPQGDHVLFDLPVDFAADTCGDGLWSSAVNTVRVTGISARISTVCDLSWGTPWWADSDLQIEFDTSTWDVARDGLIYTDSRFLAAVVSEMERLGFPADQLALMDYSEQGMQGRDYVSLDAYGLIDWLRGRGQGFVTVAELL